MCWPQSTTLSGCEAERTVDVSGDAGALRGVLEVRTGATRSRSRRQPVVDVHEPGVERSEAEPEPIRRAEVGDHIRRLERLARSATPAGGAGVRCAPRRSVVARRGEARTPAARSHRRPASTAYVGERPGLRPIASMPASAVIRAPSSVAYDAEHRRRADQEALDAVHRVVLGAHVELVALAEPAPDRLAQVGLQVATVRRGRPARPGPPLRCL